MVLVHVFWNMFRTKFQNSTRLYGVTAGFNTRLTSGWAQTSFILYLFTFWWTGTIKRTPSLLLPVPVYNVHVDWSNKERLSHWFLKRVYRHLLWIDMTHNDVMSSGSINPSKSINICIMSMCSDLIITTSLNVNYRLWRWGFHEPCVTSTTADGVDKQVQSECQATNQTPCCLRTPAHTCLCHLMQYLHCKNYLIDSFCFSCLLNALMYFSAPVKHFELLSVWIMLHR